MNKCIGPECRGCSSDECMSSQKPTGTLEGYSDKGKNTPVGKMQRERDLKMFKHMKRPKLKGLAEGGQVKKEDESIFEKAGSWIDKNVGSDKAQAAPKPSQPTGTNETGAKKLGEGWKKAGFAHGGKVDERERKASSEMKYKSGEQKGVHTGSTLSESYAGSGVRGMKKMSELPINEHRSEAQRAAHVQRNKEFSKKNHERVISESRSMPNPNIKGLAEGGEVESDDMDHEIHEMLGQELMSAIDGKDHKRIMDSIEACVLSCMNKNKG